MNNIKNKIVKVKNKSVKKKPTIKFSPSQQAALDDIKDWHINNKSLIYTLSGAAGTGKTFLVNYIIKHIFKANNLRVCVAAPTHKALRVIEGFTKTKGLTLHALHGLKPNFSLTNFKIDNIKFDTIGVNKFGNYNIIIPDESSMIGADLSSLNKLRSSQYNTKILYVGDKLQLLPVKETTISDVFNSEYNYDLTDIIRQDGDNPILDDLTRLRFDIINFKSTFLNHIKANPINMNNGIGSIRLSITKTRNYVNTVFKSDDFNTDINAFRVGCYTNKNVSIWNNYIRKVLGVKDELLVVGNRLMGYKTIVDDYNNIVIANSNDYEVVKVERRLGDDKFYLFETTLQDYITKSRIKVFIVDHTDKTFMKYYNKLIILHRNAVYGDIMNKGVLWKTYFMYKERYMTMIDFTLSYDGRARANVQREIDYAYAVSIHKLQGSTIKNIILDAMDICYIGSNRTRPRTGKDNIDMRNRLLYTGLSRAKEKGIIIYD